MANTRMSDKKENPLSVGRNLRLTMREAAALSALAMALGKPRSEILREGLRLVIAAHQDRIPQPQN